MASGDCKCEAELPGVSRASVLHQDFGPAQHYFYLLDGDGMVLIASEPVYPCGLTTPWLFLN